MSQSLARVYVHAIFSTKMRVTCLTPEIRAELFPYFATILTELNCFPIEVGGVSDHIHILCALSKSITIEDFFLKIKTPTSQWIKTKSPALRNFHWQGGYGIFSVSPSNLQKVRQYILNQDQHHKRESFQDELRRFFANYQVTYDEKYVWD